MFEGIGDFLERRKNSEKKTPQETTVFENGNEFHISLEPENPTAVLRSGGEVLLDFRTLIPGEGKITVDTGDKKGKNKQWASRMREESGEKNGEVIVGDLKGPSTIPIFLHEVGHLDENNLALSDEAYTAQMAYVQEMYQDTQNQFPQSRREALERYRNASHLAETAAWDWATGKIDELKEEFGVDIIERIGGSEIYQQLITGSSRDPFCQAELSEAGQLFSMRRSPSGEAER